MKNISVGSKFRLLDEIWTVREVCSMSQFLATTSEDKRISQDIWLDLSKADALEWIKEEKPNLMDNPVKLIDFDKFKSEIIRETLLVVAEAWWDCINQDRKEHLWDALRRKAKELK
jgi:hypothetical protein